MDIDINGANRPCPFIKTDREAAYKQLPISPERCPLAMATLRRPTLWAWFSFHPHALLSGAAAAALRYNCFSRISGAMVGEIFGTPLVTYFDDRGDMAPTEIGRLHSIQ